MSFALLVISSEQRLAGEHEALPQLFAAGLTTFHVRKPGWSRAAVKDYLQAVPAQYHPRLVLHAHYDLALEFPVHGIHLTTSARQQPDTLRLLSQTRTGTRMTTMAELGAEYNVRLSNTVDLGFSVRKFWGLGSSIVTDVDYTVNNVLAQQAQLRGTGTGMSYGVTLRYTYAIRRNFPSALEVRGKGRVR